MPSTLRPIHAQWLGLAASAIALLYPGAALANEYTPLVMAGSENGSPPDSPANHVDIPGAGSSFNGVASVRIDDGQYTYIGSAVAIDRHWVLTAGHNYDTNHDGLLDQGLSSEIIFNTGYGVTTLTPTAAYVNPQYTGFDNPYISFDLTLVYFANALPSYIPTYSLYREGLSVGDQIYFVGYGYSGYGDVSGEGGDNNLTVRPDYETRRVGSNIVDSIYSDRPGADNHVYELDFDDPSTVGMPGGSLGNDIEAMTAPGDSGGPAFVFVNGEYYVAGITTYGQSVDGIPYCAFGTLFGGMNIYAYLDWIDYTMATVPEPSQIALLMGLGTLPLLILRRRKRLH